jgi:AraC-like DNA-binding protein
MRLRSGATDWTDYRVAPGAFGIELLRAHFGGHAYERHSHEGYALGVTESGVQAFTCRGELQVSTAGRAIALNPDEPHDGHAGAPEGFTYRMLYVPAATMRGVLEGARDGRPAALPFARRPVIDDSRLAAGIGALHGMLAEGAPRLDCETLIDGTLSAFARRHGDGAARLAGFATPGEAALRRVRDFLHAAPLAEDLSGDDLARVAGLSRFHLWRAFRDRYGLPPHAYRLQLRLAAAKRLLAAGQSPAAAAAASGFADQSHLNKRFKGAYGITPGQFVAALRQRR